MPEEESQEQDLALLFRRSDIPSLAQVRGLPHAFILRQGDKLWLLLRQVNKQTALRVGQLPAWKRYIQRKNYLFSPGKSVPEDNAPEGREIPLEEFLSVELPISFSPAHNCQKMSLFLEDSHIQSTPSALLCDAMDFFEYCQNTLAIRYENLEYVRDGQRLLVKGPLLPTIPGKYYYSIKRLLIPCGTSLLPAVPASLIDTLFSEESFWESRAHSPEVLPPFQPVSLSSLRLNCEVLNRE